MPREVSNPDRQQGRYYTPRFLVEAMLRLALDPLLSSDAPSVKSPHRILDPACGEGAFLLPIAERLQSRHSEQGKGGDDQALPQLFGVDIDQAAIKALQHHDSNRIRVHWGDALTGSGFEKSDQESGTANETTSSHPQLDWRTTFSEAANVGGFDLVVGNPPYRRERASKAYLDRLKWSPLGKRWYRARLDLWAYFLHRGLDLLRPEGRLAFILPSYWTASTAARPLIERLRTETTILDVVQLGRARVFPEVEGWHLILNLVKGNGREPCRVWDLTSSGERLESHLDCVKSERVSEDRDSESDAILPIILDPSELFQQGQMCLSRPDPVVQRMGESCRRMLQASFSVRQGIVENPRCITRRLLKSLPGDYRLGEGVFVLDREELEGLKLPPKERQLLRPYFRGPDIERYSLDESPSEFLLYLTCETAPDLDGFPTIQSHLLRFRKVLECRREVKRGQLKWWHLHWPREERIFLTPRILMPQMGYAPRFVFCEKPAFVSFAMHIIGTGPDDTETDPAVRLLALTGVLNSEMASRWFQKFAKHRGVALDISGAILKRFPLPMRERHVERAIAKLVRDRQQLPQGSTEIPVLENQIESLVENWYALSGGVLQPVFRSGGFSEGVGS